MMLAVALAAAVMTMPAGAARADGEVFTLQVENDYFARATNTDRHYTTGVRAAFLSGPLSVPDWLRTVSDLPTLVLPGPQSPATYRFGVAVSQSIFTPDDTEAAALVTDDRPYAGWLHLALSLVATHQGSGGPAYQDTVQLEIGVVGPYAQGEAVQNGFHELIDQDDSAGWDNQLADEPGINLVFERKWRSAPATWSWAGLESDIIPYATLSLGNVHTYLGTGALVRISTDLLDDFGPPTIRPGMPGSESFDTKEDLGWYFFAGFGGRVVARDMFLEGNLLSNSHSVTKKHLIGEGQLGFAVALGNARLTYTHVLRSPEFRGQKQIDQYGALSLSWAFGS